MKFYALLTAALLSLAATTCYHSASAQDFEGPQEEIEKIMKASKGFSAYYVDKEFDKLAEVYTEDGAILPPGADIIKGREAIKKRWILPEGVTVTLHKATPTELKVSGDFAYDVGYYEGTTREKDGTENSWKGKYLIVWQKVDGEWKIHMDAWNRVE
ncbi:MAG: DUF4440 domain-containing protein [Cyclobacteriaceae bacterium]